MPDYYVEMCQLGATNLDDNHRCSTFDEAFDWLERRLDEDPQRIGRFKTNEPLTVEQSAWLLQRKIERIF